MQSIKVRAFTMLTGLVCSLGAGGCAEWVRYDDLPDGSSAPPPPVVGGGAVADPNDFMAPDAGTLNQATSFDHAVLGALLSRFVQFDPAQSLFDYAGLLADGDAIAQLDVYRLAVAQQNPSALVGAAEKLAFWMNAYNANVITGVLNKSSGDLSFSTSDDGFAFFAERIYLVGGYRLSLDEIEHGVIRGKLDHPNVAGSAFRTEIQAFHDELWQGAAIDPRIHVALNCAALSCPNLQRSAWLPASLDADLQLALVEFLDDADKGAGPAGISSLFSWFRDDWIGAAGSIEAFIMENRSGGLDGVNVNGCGADDSGAGCLGYDWTLNAVGN